tara:strand:+ start:230 stop:478 length:249 start_codon:yes stop_codon:yes gene_type:complete
MKIIKVNAYEFKELNQKAKNEVINWLDKLPLEYEEEDQQGNIITKYEYFSEMTESDINEHCEMNEYLFNEYGKPIHNLEIKE